MAEKEKELMEQEEMAGHDGGAAPAATAQRQPDLEELKDSRARSAAREIDFLLDIPLEITVELGRTRMLINDLLQLAQGSVLELDKLAGEPMEILINGKLVARGEVVVVNEKFGIRLTDIISPTERLKQLK